MELQITKGKNFFFFGFEWELADDFSQFGSKLAILTALAQLAATLFYFSKRLENTLAVTGSFPQKVFLASWIFLGFEALVALLVGVYAIVSVMNYKAPGSSPMVSFQFLLWIAETDLSSLASIERRFQFADNRRLHYFQWTKRSSRF